MKYSKYVLSFVTAFALLLPVYGFAATKTSGNMKLTEPAKIGNTELQPGVYKVEWSGSGENVNITILQHKNAVAEVQGQLKSGDSPLDAVVLKPAADNSSVREITEIEFGHHKEALEITPTQGQSGQ